MAPIPSSRRILFLVSAHNSLSQRALIELEESGHHVDVAVVDSATAMESAVERHRPELIVCPMLKKLIPESIWSKHRCLIVHPGPMGDRGASSLDWAIELGVREWGVTVLEADGDFDAGDVWATRTFPMREAGKASLYRHEVRRAAIAALVEAVDRVVAGEEPDTLDSSDPRVVGQARALMHQELRAIDWQADDTDAVVRKIRAAEGHPGVLDEVEGVRCHLFGVEREPALSGTPGQIIGTRHGAVCRATTDGAVWISHLKRAAEQGESHYKLPAVLALAQSGVSLDVPDLPGDTEIAYEEAAGVGYLHFDFYNGAMSTGQCRRLREAYRYARSRRTTRVIVLTGGSDFFSNGIHLNVIEAAEDPAQESWHNLHAINDVVREIVETNSHLVVSALRGDAAAGGVPLALAADLVVAREDIVLNPYYRHMGGLYGSEYWTYLLPRRVGAEHGRAAHGPAVPPRGQPEGCGDRPARRDLRLGPRELPGAGAALRGGAGRRPRPGSGAPREAAPALGRRARQAAQGLPGGGDGPLASVLFRARPQLPRGAPALRAQARPRLPDTRPRPASIGSASPPSTRGAGY